MIRISQMRSGIRSSKEFLSENEKKKLLNKLTKLNTKWEML